MREEGARGERNGGDEGRRGADAGTRHGVGDRCAVVAAEAGVGSVMAEWRATMAHANPLRGTCETH